MKGHRSWPVVVAFAAFATAAPAQTPQPFPKPGAPTRPQPAPPPAQPPPADVTARPAETRPAAVPGEPDEQTLGMPVYPAAQFLTSYDAGRGQRYYLFGTNVEFAQIVGYYRTVLKNRGNLVYEQPAVHMFEVGRYRDDAVAFPPGITVKDYTWGGSEGYLHVVAGAQPVRFRTIIQVVPPPPGVVGR
jgi:hypothetical protein